MARKRSNHSEEKELDLSIKFNARKFFKQTKKEKNMANLYAEAAGQAVFESKKSVSIELMNLPPSKEPYESRERLCRDLQQDANSH